MLACKVPCLNFHQTPGVHNGNEFFNMHVASHLCRSCSKNWSSGQRELQARAGAEFIVKLWHSAPKKYPWR